MKLSQVLAAAVLVASAACAASTGSRVQSSSSSNVITASELSATPEANLYDFVAAHRPRWLQPRSAAAGTGITVYLNSARAGGLDVLRTLSRDAAQSLRFYDVTEAQQRFPNAERGAVIQVTMK